MHMKAKRNNVNNHNNKQITTICSDTHAHTHTRAWFVHGKHHIVFCFVHLCIASSIIGFILHCPCTWYKHLTKRIHNNRKSIQQGSFCYESFLPLICVRISSLLRSSSRYNQFHEWNWIPLARNVQNERKTQRHYFTLANYHLIVWLQNVYIQVH